MTYIEEIKSRLLKLNQKPLFVLIAKGARHEVVSTGMVQTDWKVIPNVLEKFKDQLEPIATALIEVNQIEEHGISNYVFIVNTEDGSDAVYVLGISAFVDIEEVKKQLTCFLGLMTDKDVTIVPDEEGTVQLKDSMSSPSEFLEQKCQFSMEVSDVFHNAAFSFTNWLSKTTGRNNLSIQLGGENSKTTFGDGLAKIDYGVPPEPTKHSVIGRVFGMEVDSPYIKVVPIIVGKEKLTMSYDAQLNEPEMSSEMVRRYPQMVFYQKQKKSHFHPDKLVYLSSRPATVVEISEYLEEHDKDKQRDMFADL